jgi:hypothetical protein
MREAMLRRDELAGVVMRAHDGPDKAATASRRRLGVRRHQLGSGKFSGVSPPPGQRRLSPVSGARCVFQAWIATEGVS